MEPPAIPTAAEEKSTSILEGMAKRLADGRRRSQVLQAFDGPGKQGEALGRGDSPP